MECGFIEVQSKLSTGHAHISDIYTGLGGALQPVFGGWLDVHWKPGGYPKAYLYFILKEKMCYLM